VIGYRRSPSNLYRPLDVWWTANDGRKALTVATRALPLVRLTALLPPPQTASVGLVADYLPASLAIPMVLSWHRT
jgi:hypothetical protein